MIPRTYTLALIIVALSLLALCVAPRLAGAAARPKPCVGAVVRVIEGAELVRQSNGTICVRSVKALPIAPRRGK